MEPLPAGWRTPGPMSGDHATAPSDGLREAARDVVVAFTVTPAVMASVHIKALDRLAAAVALATLDAVRVAAPSDGPTCSYCGGQGWYVTADALPSGEPDEPYQVPCGECEGSGVAVRVAAPSDGLRAKAETLECIRQHFGAPRRCDEYDDGREPCAPCYVRAALAATPTDDSSTCCRLLALATCPHGNLPSESTGVTIR
jgi:hypothetical protein